jgi:hypothetical protein
MEKQIDKDCRKARGAPGQAGNSPLLCNKISLARPEKSLYFTDFYRFFDFLGDFPKPLGNASKKIC